MAVLLALLAAAGWGSSDYAAGVASRRSPAMAVVVLTHLTSALALAVVVAGPPVWRDLGITVIHLPATADGRAHLTLDLLLPGSGLGLAPPADLLWGAAAGLSGGVGAVLLFRGLARGAVSVVAPISAVVAAVLPVLAGLVTGEQLGAAGLAAVAVALVAVVMISEPAGPAARHARRIGRLAGLRRALRPAGAARPLPPAGAVRRGRRTAARRARHQQPASAAHRARHRGGAARQVARRSALRATGRVGSDWLARPGTADALGSGAGFGGFYLLLGQTGDGAGLWPILSARTASALLFAATALLARERMVARQDRRVVLLAGLLDAVAAAVFLAAARQGLLSVVAVLASLYPAATIGLARVLDDERCSRHQWAGLGLAAVSVGVLAVT